MDTPSLPIGQRYEALGYSILTIVWWVGVWGLNETIMTLLFKGSLLLRLGVYCLMIASVFVAILFDPRIIQKM
jgi:hypothetical protein